MSLATTLRRSKSRPTNQALADMALQLDQSRRAAIKAGDMTRAAELDAEILALTAMVH